MDDRTVWAGVFLMMVVSIGAGCSFDETQFQHNCSRDAGGGQGAVCRDGTWVPVEAGDADFARVDAEVVGEDCSADEDCGAAVCEQGRCVACREGQDRLSVDRCGYEGRGRRRRVCDNQRWVDGDCIGVWYRSCREYLEDNPEAPNDRYELDPDGPGQGVAPTEYACVMESKNPEAKLGWTRVAADAFEAGTEGWSPNVGRSRCGGWGWIFGGYGKLGNETIAKTFELPPIPGETLRFYVEFVKIDSWDQNEDHAALRIDGEEVWRREFRSDDGNPVCGEDGFNWQDAKVPISRDFEISGEASTRTYEVEVEGVIDEDPNNASWGIDNVLFFIR